MFSIPRVVTHSTTTCWRKIPINLRRGSFDTRAEFALVSFPRSIVFCVPFRKINYFLPRAIMRTGPDDTENTRLTNWIISLLLSGSMRVWRLYKTRYRAEHTLAGCPNKKLSCRSEPAQRFVSIKIFAKSLKSFKVIRNYYGEYGVHMILLVIHCGRKYTASQKKLDLSSFEHNSCKYCPILIILSLLQTEIICPQTNNWISYFTCSLLLHYLENATAYTSSQKLSNKSAMHAVISLLLQNRTLWWYLLLTSSMLLPTS